jgi:hypothetical protein
MKLCFTLRIKIIYTMMKYGVLTAVTMDSVFFQDVAPCNPAEM